MMVQTLITNHLNSLIWKNIIYKLIINKLNNLNNNIDWGWPYMVYLIWLAPPKLITLVKGLNSKIQNLFSTYFYFLSKDNQLA
jgi:hypothetical protein